MICRNGERLKTSVEGIPLGLLDDRDYDEVSVQVESGDTMLLYSDGLQDQQNPAGEEYGNSRIFKSLRKHCAGPPKSIVDAVFADLDAFSDGRPMNDDQTMVAIKVN